MVFLKALGHHRRGQGLSTASRAARLRPAAAEALGPDASGRGAAADALQQRMRSEERVDVPDYTLW